MKRIFVIPSLFAAGFLPARSDAMPTPGPTVRPEKKTPLFQVFRGQHRYTLAGHSSHSSHASHASHSSGGGGYSLPTPRLYSEPTPSYEPATPLYTPPVVVTPAPAPAPLVTLPGNSRKFQQIVLQVQNALHLFGYDAPLTGIVDQGTREALIQFQAQWSLAQTGTITPEVLNALGISAQ